MSGGQIVLEELGVRVTNYYSSEIDPSAIAITQDNYPNTIQLGDVTNWREWDLPKIDLLLGGSPCQGFSVNGKKLNFEDERSKLLFEFIRIRDYIKPKFWLLENVATMSNEVKIMIDEYIGVKGIEINSNSCSAQNRRRYYWTNVPFQTTTDESGLVIKDILESNVENRLHWKEEKINKQYINPSWTNGVLTLNPKMFNEKQTYQQDRIYGCEGKMVALTATLGNRFNIKDNEGVIRKLTIREQARIQTIPDRIRFSAVSDSQASKCIGNGWTIKAIAQILNYIPTIDNNRIST